MGKKKVARNKRGKVGIAETSQPPSNHQVQQRYAALDDDTDQKPGGKKKNKGKKKNAQGGYDTQLRQLIEADGSKSVIEMAADGNCLFRSLSDQLLHDFGNNHEDVRAEVCDFLEAHEEEFSGFLVLDETEEDEDASSFEHYVEKMRESSEWGGNVELVAAARLYRRNITVYSASLAVFTIDHGHGKKSPSGPDLLLSYHDNDHYNSVRDNTQGKPPPPIKTFVKAGAAETRQKTKAKFVESMLEELPGGEGDDDDEEEEVDDDDNEEKKETADAEPGSAERIREPVDPKFAKDKKLRKNDSCPCGSGLRYKRCCLAREKHNARLRRLQGERGEGSGAETEATDHHLAEDTAAKFRVMKI